MHECCLFTTTSNRKNLFLLHASWWDESQRKAKTIRKHYPHSKISLPALTLKRLFALSKVIMFHDVNPNWLETLQEEAAALKVQKMTVNSCLKWHFKAFPPRKHVAPILKSAFAFLYGHGWTLVKPHYFFLNICKVFYLTQQSWVSMAWCLLQSISYLYRFVSAIKGLSEKVGLNSWLFSPKGKQTRPV